MKSLYSLIAKCQCTNDKILYKDGLEILLKVVKQSNKRNPMIHDLVYLLNDLVQLRNDGFEYADQAQFHLMN